MPHIWCLNLDKAEIKGGGGGGGVRSGVGVGELGVARFGVGG